MVKLVIIKTHLLLVLHIFMSINKLEDLEAWQEARKLRKDIYLLIENFFKSEEYNLKKYLRESSRGTALNITEGFSRFF